MGIVLSRGAVLFSEGPLSEVPLLQLHAPHELSLLLTSHPQANGFYGAKGVAGHVPSMYVHFARKFLEAIEESGNESRVRYWEYLRPHWTFHGKGMWYYSAREHWPSATFIGSSNYGENFN